MTGRATGFMQKLLSTAEHSQPLTAACGLVYPSKPIKARTQHLKFRGQERLGQACEDLS
jgi:hypothetical protein